MIQLYDMGKNLNEPRMTPIGTDQGRKEGRESALICAIGFALRLSVAALERGSKQFEPGKRKALAGFDATGHPGNHIQSALSIPFAPPSLTL